MPSQPAPTLIGDVAFSVPSQTFMGELRVGLSTAVPAAEIRYSTDGEPPTSGSMRYDGTPFTLSKTTQLRAQAFVSGAASGKLRSATTRRTSTW